MLSRLEKRELTVAPVASSESRAFALYVYIYDPDQECEFLWFAPNHGVTVKPALLNKPPEEIKQLLTIALTHNENPYLMEMIDGGIPYICASTECECTDDLTLDHVIPLSRGGTDEIANLQFLCRSHNSKKGDRKEVAA